MHRQIVLNLVMWPIPTPVLAGSGSKGSSRGHLSQSLSYGLALTPLGEADYT